MRMTTKSDATTVAATAASTSNNYNNYYNQHQNNHHQQTAQYFLNKCLLSATVTTTTTAATATVGDHHNKTTLDSAVDEVETILFSFECFHFKFTHDLKFFLLTMLFFFLISLDVVSNLVVLMSIIFEKSKKRVDLCFASNALADLLMGLVIMPFTAIFTLFGYFPFGSLVCFLWNVMDFTAGTASMLHIAFISYDRYLSVSKPYKYTQKSNNQRFSVTGIPTCLILVFIWFFALAAWIPALLYFKSRNQSANTNFFITEEFVNTGTEANSVNGSSNGNILGECNLEAPPIIVIPHSFIVYYLPMILIVLFYSKTISIVNQKVKRRRSSLVSTKYSATIHQQAAASLRQNHLLISSGKTSRRIKKLFNLTGRNKRANARTFAQHMKTLNMVSVYLLVQPTSTKSGEGGEAGASGGSGGSATSGGGRGRGSGGDGRGADAIDTQPIHRRTSTTTTSNKNIIISSTNGEYDREKENAETTTMTSAAILAAMPTDATTRTFNNSLSFEIRKVDGNVLMVDDIEEEMTMTTTANTQQQQQQQQLGEPVVTRTFNNSSSSSTNNKFLGIEEVNIVFVNNSSSINSTVSSHIIDSSTNAMSDEAAATTINDNETVTSENNLLCNCHHQSPATPKLNHAKSKQICISLENNSGPLEQSNDDQKKKDQLYVKKNHNRSFHSNLVRLNQKLKKANSLTHNDESDKQLRRCSDFSRLNIEEEYAEAYETKTKKTKETTSPSPCASRVDSDREIYCSNSIEPLSNTSAAANRSNSSLLLVEGQKSNKFSSNESTTANNICSTTPDNNELIGKKKTVANGILKYKNSGDATDAGGGNNNEQDRDNRDGSVSPSASVKIKSNGNGVINNNKTLSFRISHEYEEQINNTTGNGIRLASNSNKRERNVTYKLGLIMITFIVSWLPFSIMWPLVSLRANFVSESAYIFSFWLAYLNSVFTPIILLYNNVKYRRSMFIFLRLFVLNPFNFVFRRSVYKNGGGGTSSVAAISPRSNIFNNNNTTNNENFVFEFVAANSNVFGGVESSRASFCRRPSLVNHHRRSIRINS